MKRAIALVARVARGVFLILPFLPFLPYPPRPPYPPDPPVRRPPPERSRKAACSRRRISACSKRPIAISGRSPIRSWTRSAIADGVGGRRSRRRRRLVHAAARAPRRAERPRLRRRHPAAMLEAISRRVQRENLSNVPHGARHAERSAAADRARRGADRRRVSRDGRSGDPTSSSRCCRTSRESLKPQGRLGIVDFTPGGGGPGRRRSSASIPKR